jgi:hypothetical protein
VSGGPIDRAATFVLLTIGRRLWGITAVLMPEIVAVLGPFGALAWLARNMPKFEEGLKVMGGLRGNLVYTCASMANGCSYCTYAHARAFELYYYKATGRLFPLDEQQIVSLIALEDADVWRHLEGALREAELDAEVPVLRRLFALKLEGAEPGPDDGHLVHAIAMYDTLNRCAILSQAAVDDAHDRINKDAALKESYAAARLRAGKYSIPWSPTD